MKRILVIDALNMFYRAYAKDPSLSLSGNPIGGCLGFLKSFQKSIRLTSPDDVVIVWDGAGGSNKKRHINKEYKQGRRVVHMPKDMNGKLEGEEELHNKIWQQSRLFEYLDNLPFCQFTFEGVEADDVIAAIVQSDVTSDMQKVIFSNDYDFMQLCNKSTVLYRPAKNSILSLSTILEEYKIHPNNMALARAIAGDKSDNLPGVPGVGLFTVAKYFPFLSEEEDYSVQDLIVKCEDKLLNEKKGKRTLEKILEHGEAIQQNYRIMQLYNPSISYNSKKEVDYCLSNVERHYNMTKFRLMLAEDGFMSYGWNILETTMKRIITQ